jgi:hypothetical protein
MAAQTTYVSNEVWRQLPQRRLPRGRAVGTLIGLLVAGVLLGLCQFAGLFTPHFSSMANGSSARQGSHRLTEDLLITNSGWLTTTVTGVRPTASWLHVTKVSIDPLNTSGQRHAGNIVTLGPSQSVTYKVEMSIPDCGAIAKTGSAVAISADGPLWKRTVEFQPEGTNYLSAPPEYKWTGPTNPYLIPWPVEYATLACTVADK